MVMGLLAATNESGAPAAAPPPRTPGSDCAKPCRTNSNERNSVNVMTRRVVMAPPPKRLERDTRTRRKADATFALVTTRGRSEGATGHYLTLVTNLPPIGWALVRSVDAS